MGPRRSLGELYFNFNEYSRAVKELERFMSNEPPFTERYKVNLMLAKSYAMLRLYKKAGSALAGAGRGFDWSRFAGLPEFAEMVNSKTYARYFNQ
jgi:predicted Zn-dependent protease